MHPVIIYPLSAEEVREIQQMNRRGEKPDTLKPDYVPAAPEFVTAVGDDSISRFDNQLRSRKKKKNRNRNKGNGSR